MIGSLRVIYLGFCLTVAFAVWLLADATQRVQENVAMLPPIPIDGEVKHEEG